MERVIRFLLAVALLAMAGCKTTKTPDLFNPGTVDSQRRDATRFDPYPEPGVGPSVEGARPPGFEQPVPETNRARWVIPPSNQ